MTSLFQEVILPIRRAGACLEAVKRSVVQSLLKQVSRSFYLSLRLLPSPMRDAAGLAYLLARASDTIADTAKTDPARRIEALDLFASQLHDDSPHPTWSGDFILAIEDPGERELMNMSHRLIEWMHGMPAGEVGLIQEVLKVIISGQRQDLELFGDADGESPVIIGTEKDLDDYTYRVAGCVGEFWTRLGFETLGTRFSDASEVELSEMGANYGKGLQLINILRDAPGDLKSGRCYLPVSDARDQEQLMAQHRKQWDRAMSLVQQGLTYASQLKGRRLRMASVMPALLGEDTLELMRGADWANLTNGVKIPRRRVYGNLIQSVLY